jgi:hypothetical protein
MAFTFTIDVLTPIIKETKLKLSYYRQIDGIWTAQKTSSKWEPNNIINSLSIDLDTLTGSMYDGYVRVYVYFTTKTDMAYRYKFSYTIKDKNNIITIINGIKDPIVTLNGMHAERRDELDECSCWVCCCGCCSVERGLDDLEQAEHDANCIIS